MPNAIYENGDSGVEVDPTLASGLRGHHGWSMVTALIADGERRVRRVVDWTGGEGLKPDLGGYLGPLGLVDDIAEATDDRGPTGAPGVPGEDGDPGVDGRSAYQISVDNGFVGTELEWINFYVNEIAEAATAEAIDARDVSQAWAISETDVEPGLPSAKTSAAAAAASAVAAGGAIGGVVYDTTAAGIAATVNGQVFIVKGDGVNTYALMYKNVATVATLIASFPSKVALDAVLTALAPVLAKFGETVLRIGGKRVIGGFADSDNRFPLAVLVDGEVLVPKLQMPGDGVPQYYAGKRVIGGFEDSTGRYALAILSDGSVWAPKLRFDTTTLVITEAQIAAPALALLRSSLVLPSQDVACYGDSLTQSGLATALSTALGRSVANRGYGSQNSFQIAMRQGGLGVKVRISGNQIATGANTITHFNGAAVSGSAGGMLTQLLTRKDANTTLTIQAEIAGVIGTVTRTATGGPPSTAEVYTFTPDVGQTVPVTCPPDSAMVVQSQADAALTQVIWVGRNDRGIDINSWSIIANVRAMVSRLTAAGKRFVILGFHNGTNYPDEWVGGALYGQIIAAHTELAAAFPANFFDVRRYLIDKGLADAGITPTAQDLIDIANDVVPRSLMTDGLHLTAVAYALVAQQVKLRFFTPNGW
ncbi:MAG: SGNH/GDSL hydrolase family protein [Mesorhizobium sp.]|uniref:SGNH/GDSL hydrolase family protein n=1 Tax=Mesorhizobium sp. TaxID=1871066 RepID=UPI000FE69F93|nr:SGNH/GDSL hydrolase family protein [Mesorhizobium sp.]RWQ35853.1 MAG: SGNH/GDSL hydrolase family protein [Mesorhizobium sp.]